MATAMCTAFLAGELQGERCCRTSSPLRTLHITGFYILSSQLEDPVCSEHFFFVLSFFFSIWEVARKEVNSYKSQIYVRLEPGSRNSMQILPRYHRTCSLPVCTSAGSRMRIDRAGQAAGTPPTQDTSIPSSTWMTAPWKLSVCVWRKGPFISMFYFLTGFSLYCESIVLNVSCKMRLTPSFKLHLPVL